MKKIFLFVINLFLCFSFLSAQNNVIEAELQTILNQKSDGLIDINIVFKSQMSSEYLSSLNYKCDSREVRREIVVNELKKFSEQSQKDVMDLIKAEAKNNKVIDINAHWLVNSINCKATRDVIYQLASHPDIEIIGYNKEEDIADINISEEYNLTRANASIAQHITHINVDKVWKLGYTGKGVKIAVIDSGVNYDHVDLKDHLWYDEGNSYPGYNFLNKGTAPIDNKGHGTHCAGVISGDGTSGTATGVAPGASIMCLKVNDTGSTQLNTIVEAVEYAVTKGADIISISKNGWSNESAHITFRNLFNNVMEANIIAAVSAGNYRANLYSDMPVPNNVLAPANCPPPYLSPDQTLTGGLSSVVCIGSIGYDNKVASFSSQGPVTWENVTGYKDYPYSNGYKMGLIRPDLVAPGESILSLDYTSNNGIVTTNGTSISTPMVAGVMALMLEKNPDLTPADICRILETTATKLATKKNNDTGSGCVDALAAVQNTNFDTNGAKVNLYSFDETINAKQNANFSVTVINNGKGTGSGSVTLSTTNENITITNATATYSGLAAGKTVALNFTADVNINTTDQEIATFTINIDGKVSEVDVIISNELLPPTNITATLQGTDVTLSWDAANNATSYNIYRGGSYLANTASTSYTDENLDYGTLYTYSITTKRNDLESGHSIYIRVQTEDNPDAPSPTNVTAKNNDSDILVEWINSPTSTSSNVYRKDNVSGTETKLASNINETSYTDNTWSSLPSGVYQYGVSNNYAKNETVYEEGFESISITNEVSKYETNDTYWYYYKSGEGNKYNWNLKSSVTNGPSNNQKEFNSYSGNAAFIISSYNNSSYLSYLVTRQMDYTQYDGSNVKLSFYYITPAWGTDINTLKVMISTTSYNSGWTELWSSNKTDVSDWTKAEVDLSAYVGQKFYIAFLNVVGYGYCTGVDNVTISAEGNKESRIEWSANVYKDINDINVFVKDGDWSDADNWEAKRLPNENERIIIDAHATINSGDITLISLTINEGKSLTLNNGVVLTVNGDFVNDDTDAFIINDGAQVFHNNDNVAATFNMNIANPEKWVGDNKTGWQFITSPVKNANVDDFVPENSDYDLYRYLGSKDLEWINHKNATNNDWNIFQQGVGYLASYQTETNATFKGILHNEKSYEFEVGYDNQNDLANFHLLGNPFSFNMDWNKSNVKLNGSVYNGYATVNSTDGSYDYFAYGTIPVGDGFFVKTIGTYPTIEYTYTGNTTSSSDTEMENLKYINVVATGNQGSDNLIIKFDGKEEEGFAKLGNINPNVADVFVVNKDKRFSILGYDENTTKVELFFDAKEMGKYTISMDANGKFDEVTLVDRFTGVETNMLIEDGYDFTATSNDDPNRFVIRLTDDQGLTANTINGSFVYQSGNELIVTTEGLVRIVDMMGRVVCSDFVTADNNRIDISGFNNAAYIIRLITENEVKTQKVVLH